MPKSNIKKEFGDIYDRYVDKIYRFIFIKVSSQDIAEDLTSETFVRGWESLKRGSAIENYQAFLYKIARNLVIDHYREKGRAEVVSTEFVSIADAGPSTEEKMAFNSDLAQVKAVLADLKEDYQNVIIWRYLDDLPMKEVSEMLGRSEEATRVLLHRALESVKQKINSI